jgi:hypothetical protein
LHAKSLGFVHPVTKEEMFFDSEYPDDLKAVLERWVKYFENRITKENPQYLEEEEDDSEKS